MHGPETRESLLARLSSPQSDEGWREFATIYRPLVYRGVYQRGQVSLLTVYSEVARLQHHFRRNQECQDHHGLTKPEDCITL